MKNLIFLFLVLGFISCKKESTESFGKSEDSQTNIPTPEVMGKEIVEGRGNCMACHQIATKTIGPSMQDIAKAYRGQKGDLVAFLKEEKAPIVDPSQYELMKSNFALTEEMSDEELAAIEAYFYSHSK